jgi:hypothetical protein
MAIKNTILGGTDWKVGDFAIYTDINDTFDELYNFLKGL